MSTRAKEQIIVVEVQGGVVQATYSDIENLRMVLIDWDELEAGGESSDRYPLDRIADMPDETCAQVGRALLRSSKV